MLRALSRSKPTPIYTHIDNVIESISRVIAWSNLALIAVIIIQVVLRKVFSNGQIAFEELQWHLYATAVMFGTAYSQVTNLHVRVDLFYHKFTERRKAWVDIIGLSLFAIPFVLVVIVHSYDFTYEAWRVNERSSSPSGLPFRWLIKAVIPVSFTLLLMSLVSRILRNIHTLKGGHHGS
ncbi:TRAP transporter small permease subunit [uncultured Vibrio sp.]|uniref:TRAP transporter small permease subunit n=1 Tax=uncultured Vibrio sp. TaxID=114054 RepID=UPI0025E64BED|nr:TRAP transporter small permease subunit [uncultured Vibrio sp.]